MVRFGALYISEQYKAPKRRGAQDNLSPAIPPSRWACLLCFWKFTTSNCVYYVYCVLRHWVSYVVARMIGRVLWRSSTRILLIKQVTV